MSNLRSRLARLENAPGPGPAADQPPHLWSWLAREPLDAATAKECHDWFLAQLPADRTPYRERAEQRIEAALAERLRNERPRCGFRELAPDPDPAVNSNGLTPPPSAAADAQQG
jgi:hypothetical protein